MRSNVKDVIMTCGQYFKHLLNLKTRITCRLNVVRHKCDGTKVVILNSFNKVGILTAYLLKKTILFEEICLYEHSNTPAITGLVADLNNISTPSYVTSYRGKTAVCEALKDADIVVMLEKCMDLQIKDSYDCLRSKQCKTPLESANDILNKAFVENAEYCAKLAELYAKICPTALLLVTMRPVNSTVPLVCKVASRLNYLVNIQKIFGFTSLDIAAANLLWAKNSKVKIETVKIPVVGGTSSYTTIPLFSQMKLPAAKDAEEEKNQITIIKNLTEDVRKRNEAAFLHPKTPLSTASALASFVISLGTAIKGKEMKEYAYVHSNLLPTLTYLAGPIQLGPSGVQQILPIPPNVSPYEKLLLESISFYLINDIQRGENYAEKYLMKINCT